MVFVAAESGYSCLMLMLLTLATLASAPAVAWPKPKTTIYVSATLTHTQTPSAFKQALIGPGGPQEASALPACVPLLVGKVKEKKKLFLATDDAKGFHKFYGVWLTRIHQTESECEAYLSEHGEPKVINSVFNYYGGSNVEHQFISNRAKPPEKGGPPPTP